MSDDSPWRLRFERERAARREAETLLHEKSRELFESNQLLEARATELSASLAQLREAQETLVRQEKMASLGGLVAGIAHEINTPLGVAITAITLGEERLSELLHRTSTGQLTRGDMKSLLGEVAESLKLAFSNLQRGAALVQSFKKVAVDQSMEAPKELSLDELLGDVTESLRPMMKRAQVAAEVTVNVRPRVLIDAGALIQVLTNLLQNACVHAFDEGCSDRTVRLVLDQDEGGVRLRVADNGVGMSEAVVRNVFEPFFTTKRATGGSGLGMHITHNLVTGRFGGQISLRSSPGQGTEWILRLPYGTPALSLLP
ncbi:MAG: sensor histidine kinase [Myxococcota bacterium]